MLFQNIFCAPKRILKGSLYHKDKLLTIRKALWTPCLYQSKQMLIICYQLIKYRLTVTYNYRIFTIGKVNVIYQHSM